MRKVHPPLTRQRNRPLRQRYQASADSPPPHLGDDDRDYADRDDDDSDDTDDECGYCQYDTGYWG